MKIIDINDLDYIASSHEDPKNPSALKKILFTKTDFTVGKNLQMINWACLSKGKTFASHYHTDMDEIFILLNGKAKIKINDETCIVGKMQAVFIPAKSVHQMENIGNEDLFYLAIGVTGEENGKTVVV